MLEHVPFYTIRAFGVYIKEELHCTCMMNHLLKQRVVTRRVSMLSSGIMTQIAFYLFSDKFLWTGSRQYFGTVSKPTGPQTTIFPITLFIVKLGLTLELRLPKYSKLFSTSHPSTANGKKFYLKLK